MADERTTVVKTGTIKMWNAERGFGFISRADGEPDIFAHIREVDSDADELPRGARVEFEVFRNPRNQKLEAHNVRVVGAQHD